MEYKYVKLNEIFYEVKGYKCSLDKLKEIWKNVPLSIKFIGKERGYDDTEFRDTLYSYIIGG